MDTSFPDALPDLDALLEALGALETGDARDRILRDLARRLAETPDTVAELAALAATARDEDRAAAAEAMLGAVLEEASGAIGAGLTDLQAAREAIETRLAALDEAGRLEDSARLRLARAHARAGLEPPARLSAPARAGGDGIVGALDPQTPPQPAPTARLLEAVAKAAEGDPLKAHVRLSETLGELPAEMRAALAGQIALRPGWLETRLTRYWLLDPDPDMRLAAAIALETRAEAGALDGQTACALTGLRRWLPSDAARDALDGAIRQVLRRGMAAEAGMTEPWRIDRALAALPDGAGRQSLVAAVRHGSRRAVARLRLEQGRGVRHAVLLPCAGAEEQRDLLAAAREEMHGFDIRPGHIARSLALGLGENAAQRRPPAPGLADMVLLWGRETPAPVASRAADILETIGATSRLAAMSERDRLALVARSADWIETHPPLPSWLEDDAELRAQLARAGRERILGAHLQTRREDWARQMAISAATLKARAEGEDPRWLSFAATARALLERRAIERLPLMKTRLAMTRDSHGAPDATARPTPQPGPDAAPADHALKTLAATLQRPQPFVEGYLAALAVAPIPPEPAIWIGRLVDGLDIEPGKRLHPLLRSLVDAADRIDETMAAPDGPAAPGTGEAQDWAQGFLALLDATPDNWPLTALELRDRRLLRRVRTAAAGVGTETLPARLPSWLAGRRMRRGRA